MASVSVPIVIFTMPKDEEKYILKRGHKGFVFAYSTNTAHEYYRYWVLANL